MLKKVALIVLILITYFLAIRPAREYYTTHLVAPEVNAWTGNFSDLGDSKVIVTPKSKKSFFLNFRVGDIQKETIYSPQAGLFLLLAAIGLVFITLKWQYYVFLLGLHLVFEIIIIFALWIGTTYSSLGLIFVDFIISYLSPIISLGMIPTLLFYSNKASSLKDHQ